VLDLGAHVGYYTLLLARLVRPGGRVALEPDPDNFALLSRNVALNGYASRVSLYNLAATDTPGKLALYVRPTTPATTASTRPTAGRGAGGDGRVDRAEPAGESDAGVLAIRAGASRVRRRATTRPAGRVGVPPIRGGRGRAVRAPDRPAGAAGQVPGGRRRVHQPVVRQGAAGARSRCVVKPSLTSRLAFATPRPRPLMTRLLQPLFAQLTAA